MAERMALTLIETSPTNRHRSALHPPFAEEELASDKDRPPEMPGPSRNFTTVSTILGLISLSGVSHDTDGDGIRNAQTVDKLWLQPASRMRAVILPPPWTETGLMPTASGKTMSRESDQRSALPP
jgi:hypothetical protein